MIEKEPEGTSEFRLSAEEEELIRRSEQEANARVSGTPVHPVELAPCLRNLGLQLEQFDIRGDQDFSKNISPPS